MDPAGLQVMNTRLPFDPTADVRITHTVQQGRTSDNDNDNNQNRGLILNHYLRGPSVGKGQHGTVYKCYDLTRNNVEVAIKVVSRHNPRADRLNQLKRKKIPRSGPHLPVTDNLGSQEYKIKKEIAIMKLCRHPHIVRLLEVIDDKLYQKVYMVMEFLGGGEIKWRDADSNPVLRVDQSRRICRDVILGLEYLHFQGIIHRDIKPANLMWTSDRRTVKITDFGVAHISATQRFAGSGKNRPAAGKSTAESDHNDLQLLFDDSELCKTAGTPSFLAPEVVYDFGTDIPPLSSSELLAVRDSNSATTLHASSPPPTHRPPITKAIDVWAFGVTLYCLLFGKTPFRVENNHEFALYGVICTQDWDVPTFMGLDCIPTKGRHHDCLDDTPCSEGAEIIGLLERLLQKDMSKRITLDEAKRHRWFLRDIPDRERWVRDTLPDSKVVTTITEDAISDAVSPIRFRWRQRLTNRLTSFLRTVRPKRSFRSADGHSDSDDIGVRSLPSVRINRYSTKNDTSTSRRTSGHPRTQPSSSKSSREPTHVSSHSRSDATHHHRQTPSSSRSQTQRSVFDITSPQRSKSSDTRPLAGSSSGSVSQQAHKGLDRRRGSVSLLSAAHDRPTASLHSNATSPDEPRPRSRFSLSSLRWRRGDPPTVSTSASVSTCVSVSTSTPATPPMPSREPSGPAPAQQQQQYHQRQQQQQRLDLETVDVGPAMRASSWGDVGEYGRLLRAHEAASMHSAAGEEPLDPDVVVVGAGGVAHGPLPPTPSGSAGLLAALALPHQQQHQPSYDGTQPCQQVVSSYSSEGDGDASDADSDSFFARNSEDAAAAAAAAAVARGAFSRAHHLHPHHHHHAAAHINAHTGCGDEEDEDDGGWGFNGIGAEPRSRAKGGIYGPSVEECEYDEEDEDEDEGSDGPAIEVRRRRPSWAVHHDEQHEGDDEDDEDEGGPLPLPPPPSSSSPREGEPGWR